MIAESYITGNSVLHRASPALKIVGLAVYCTVVFMFEGWRPLAVAGLLLSGGYGIAGLGWRHILQGIRPAIPVLAAVFLFQWLTVDLSLAAFILIRFACLILAAHLVTTTTRSSEFVDGIMRLLRSAPRWVPAAQIALSVSLALRFIPMIRAIFNEIRMAQRARGLDKSLLALLVPLMVRTLKSGDQIADAIRARSPDLEDRDK